MTQENISRDKIQANQQNAQHSTGPRTDQGKQRSSQNAIKHGLLAKQAVLPGENLHEYDGHLTSLERDLQPANFLEFSLVRQMLDAEWRLRRLTRIETSITIHAVADRRRYRAETHTGPDDPNIYGDPNIDDDPAGYGTGLSPETVEALRETEIFGDAMSHQDRTLDTYSRYGARLLRQFNGAIQEFTKLRESRIAASLPPSEPDHLRRRPPQSEPEYTPPPPTDPFEASPPPPPHDPDAPITLEQSLDPAERARLRGENTKPTHQLPTNTNQTTYTNDPTEPRTQVRGSEPDPDPPNR